MSSFLGQLLCSGASSYDISPNDIANGALSSLCPTRQPVGGNLTGEKFISSAGKYHGTILSATLESMRVGIKQELPILLKSLCVTPYVKLTDMAVARCPFPQALEHLSEWNGTVIMVPGGDCDGRSPPPAAHSAAMLARYDALSTIKEMLHHSVEGVSTAELISQTRVAIHFDRLRSVKGNWGMGTPPLNYVTEVTCAFPPSAAFTSLASGEVQWLLCAAYESCVLAALLNVCRSAHTQTDVAQLCCSTRLKPYYQDPPRVVLTVPSSFAQLSAAVQMTVLEAALRHVLDVLKQWNMHIPIRVMLPTEALVHEVGKLMNVLKDLVMSVEGSSLPVESAFGLRHSGTTSTVQSRSNVSERCSAEPQHLAGSDGVGRYHSVGSSTQPTTGSQTYSAQRCSGKQSEATFNRRPTPPPDLPDSLINNTTSMSQSAMKFQIGLRGDAASPISGATPTCGVTSSLSVATSSPGYPIMTSSKFPTINISVVNKAIFDITADVVISLYALGNSSASNKLQASMLARCGPSLHDELEAAIDAQFQGDTAQEYKVIVTAPLNQSHLWKQICHVLRGRSLSPAQFAQKSLMEIVTDIKPKSILIDCDGVFGGGPCDVAERTKVMLETVSAEFQKVEQSLTGVVFLLATNNNDKESEEIMKRELGIAASSSTPQGPSSPSDMPALQRTPSEHLLLSSFKVTIRLYSQNLLLERKYAAKMWKPETRVSAKARQSAMWAHLDNVLLPSDPSVDSPDIICLQEVDPGQLPQMNAKYGSQYDARVGGPLEGNEVCVILSKRSRLHLVGPSRHAAKSYPDGDNTCAVCQQYQCAEKPSIRFVVLCFKMQGNETSTQAASIFFKSLIDSAIVATGISRCLICGDLGGVGLPALSIPGLNFRFESALHSIAHTTQEMKKPDAILHSTLGADLVPQSVSAIPSDHRKLISLGGGENDGALLTSRDTYFSNHKGLYAAFELW